MTERKQQRASGVGKHPDNFWLRLGLTYGSSLVAESLTYPLDMTKTRLQLQNQGVRHGQQRLGAVQMAAFIVRSEGLSGMFRGLTPALLRHAVYTPARIVGYETLRERLAADGDVAHLGIWQRCLAGSVAGVAGQFIASPTDLVKVRMQAAGRGQGPRYNGMADAFRQIVAQNGVRGLWKGCVPNLQRAALVNLGELATYDTAKHALLDSGHFADNIWCHGAASLVSGFVSAFVSSPADLVKSRLMAQGDAHIYRGTLHCFVQSVKTEGVFSLWKGFLPAWSRLAPWQLAFWLVYEELRHFSGMQSF